MKNLISISLTFALSIITVLSFIGFLGNENWLFDLFSHFKLQYFYLLILGTTILYLLDKKKVVLIFLIPAIFNGIEIYSIYFGGNKDITSTTTLKICSSNVLSSNDEFQKFEKLITTEKPDIIILQELNFIWKKRTDEYLKEYTYKKVVPRGDNFGIAIYSRKKLEKTEIINLGTNDIPSIFCQIKVKDQTLNILGTHPLPPVGRTYSNHRNSQLESIALLASETTNHFIVLGDLNTTSYSHHFKKLLKNGNLIDSRKGFGIQGSWPTWLPLASITLDHCLASKDVIIKSRKMGPNIGSDHLPVILEIGLKQTDDIN